MADAGSDNPAARVSGDEPGATDFTQQALAQLHILGRSIQVHADVYADDPSNINRTSLIEDFQRFRNTLVILEKSAAVYVASELLDLLQADANGELANQSEVARVLTSAGDKLCKHVELLQRDFSRDSALPLLSLVNDSRACREETLLSDSLVLAAGIEIPKSKAVEAHSTRWLSQRQYWIKFSSARHARIARGLLYWWQSAEPDALQPLIRELTRFARAAGKHEYLHSLQPLFQAALTVGSAIADTTLTDGPALRSLFAQLERSVYRSALVKTPEDLVPQDLLRNFLFYVAQTNIDTSIAKELRRRFRLDRVSAAAYANQNTQTPTIGVGYHLANSIRSGVIRETEPLRHWLDSSDSADAPPPDHVKLVRLRVRLSQLEPVLTLMGAPDALVCLQQINAVLKSVNRSEALPPSERDGLAKALSELDSLLDKSARSSIRGSSAQSQTKQVDSSGVFIDMATDACLLEARNRLQYVADSLSKSPFRSVLDSQVVITATEQLSIVSYSLQILPLPEVSALLIDVCQLLQQLTQDISDLLLDSAGEEIVSVLVSLDSYLACVLLPQPEASQWLIDAEDALERVRTQLSHGFISRENVDEIDDRDGATERILELMDRLGDSISLYREHSELSTIVGIADALKGLAGAAGDATATRVSELGKASDRWLHGVIRVRPDGLSERSLFMLDDILALIPQILNQESAEAARIPGFVELMQQLETAPDILVAQTDLDLDESFELECDDEALALSEDIGSLTLNVDDELLESLDDVDGMRLDSTLQQVFYHECFTHLEQLEASVKAALQPRPDASQRLPNEQMLRALHTLTGSAQTIDAIDIVNIVQPLQRSALARQRLESSFDAAETRFVGDIVMALRARLEAMKTGGQVGRSVEAVEQKIKLFLASSVPGSDASDSGLAMGEHLHSLDGVFAEEAREILDRLRSAVYSDPYTQQSTRSSLALLHTLKGSARMAGKAGIAQLSHDLEAQVQQSPEDPNTQHGLLKDGYQRLHALLLNGEALLVVNNASVEKDTADMVSSPGGLSGSSSANANLWAGESLQVSDAGFDNLLDLATDVIVSQARLSDELASLREVYQDIESASARWHRFSAETDAGDSQASRETMADLEAARAVMRNALRQAEREQQQASRASAGLQQSLIRTRLVRIDELDNRLSRIVQDAVEMTGHSAELVYEGGEVTLDRNLFKQLIAPLEHLVRNAVVHGIESPDVRLNNGKSTQGRLVINASIDGTDLVIQFSDDGSGIDRDAINARLLTRGQPPADTLESMQDALFSSGFSTLESADALAGHGLGLSAVQETIVQLGGVVQLDSRVGSGTRISLRIPQRMVVSQVVLVQSQNQLFAVPVARIEAVRQAGVNPLEENSVSRSHSLSELLGQQSTDMPTRARSGPVVIVSSAEQLIAVEVDQILGYREVVNQALGPQLASLGYFSGGSVMSDGKQVLILDIERLIESQNPSAKRTANRVRKSLRPVALIVDDSLTMRAAAEAVLRQNGIATRVSRDGLEALESLDIALPNLVLLDLEMPRLDGVNVLRRMRENYGEDCPPVIVVSSKDDSQNKESLLKQGAVRFLTKPYTESQLLEAVEAAGLRLPDLTIA